MTSDDRQHPLHVTHVALVDDPALIAAGCTLRLDPPQCDGVDCPCGDEDWFILRLSPYQLRRLYWRNLSPVVERLSSGGVTIARHVDGRFTVEAG